MGETNRGRRILLIWEFGGAMGHLVRLLPIMRALRARGHRVSLALQSTPRHALVPEGVRLLPIPVMPASRQPISQPVSIADILHNVGVCDSEALAGQARAWRGLIETVAPDAVVLDYSPTALLALQGMGLPIIQIGTGFASPPAVSPLPNLREWQNHYPDRIMATETAVCAALNAQLERQGQPALANIGELFGRLDWNVLATFPELDHYPGEGRGENGGDYRGDYRGTWGETMAAGPVWPETEGPKIFVYLKPFRGLRAILDELARRRLSSVVYIGGPFDPGRWDNSTVRISPVPLNMRQAARQCDLAILNAGHGATAAMLLAGVPLLQLPIQIEQYHNAEACARLGAGLRVDLGDQDTFLSALDRLLSDTRYRQAAASFARRYRDHDPESTVEQIVAGIIERASDKG